MTSERGVKAWIVYWEASGEHAETYARNGEVVAVLPPRWGEKRVRDIVERLYQERASSLRELVLWRTADSSPYPLKRSHNIGGVEVVDFGVYCGHNPFLRAIKVENLTVLDENSLEWDEFQPGRGRSPRHRRRWSKT